MDVGVGECEGIADDDGVSDRPWRRSFDTSNIVHKIEQRHHFRSAACRCADDVRPLRSPAQRARLLANAEMRSDARA